MAWGKGTTDSVNKAEAKADAVKALTVGDDTPDRDFNIWVDVKGEKGGWRLNVETDAHMNKLPHPDGRNYNLSSLGTNTQFIPHPNVSTHYVIKQARDLLQSFLADYDRWFSSCKVDRNGNVYDKQNFEYDD